MLAFLSFFVRFSNKKAINNMKRIDAIKNLYGSHILTTSWSLDTLSSRIATVQIFIKNISYFIIDIGMFYFYGFYKIRVSVTLSKVPLIFNASTVSTSWSWNTFCTSLVSVLVVSTINCQEIAPKYSDLKISYLKAIHTSYLAITSSKTFTKHDIA